MALSSAYLCLELGVNAVASQSIFLVSVALVMKATSHTSQQFTQQRIIFILWIFLTYQKQ